MYDRGIPIVSTPITTSVTDVINVLSPLTQCARHVVDVMI